MGGEAGRFEVEEVLVENGELVVLSLGFASAREPLDVLHIVSGTALSGKQPRPVEDELYLERTDQSLACTGGVERITCREGEIVMTLTAQAAELLQLSQVTCFTFEAHPALYGQAAGQLAAMARIGGRSEIAIASADD
ncbi:hypothetical protein ACWIGM_19410 [Bosea sp. NPDC055332]